MVGIEPCHPVSFLLVCGDEWIKIVLMDDYYSKVWEGVGDPYV